MFAYTWNKLYERSLIVENGFKFSNQVLIEDFIFNTLYWDKISSVCIIPKSGYHYVKASKEALTQKFLPDFLKIMDKRFDYMKALMVKNSVYYDSVKMQLANIYIKHALAGVVRNCAPEGKSLSVRVLGGIEGLLPELIHDLRGAALIGALVNANFHCHLSVSRRFFFFLLTS